MRPPDQSFPGQPLEYRQSGEPGQRLECRRSSRYRCENKGILSHSITRQACRPCFIEGTGTLKSSKKGVLREAKAVPLLV